MPRRKRGSFLSRQATVPASGTARLLLTIFSLILVGLILLVVVAYLFFMSWLQGDGCRTKLADFLQQATHAQQVSVPDNLEVNGNQLTVPQFTLLHANHFEELSVHKLHMSVDRKALWNRILRMNQFSAEELRLVLRAEQKSAANSSPATSPSSTRTSRHASTSGRQSPSTHAGFFRAVQARSCEVHYADTTLLSSGREFGLKGYRMTATPCPEAGNDAWTLNIENGRVVSPFSWLAESGVKTATIKLTTGEIKLTSCRIILSPGGIHAKAVYSPSTGRWEAHADVRRASVSRLLKQAWKKKLTGALVGHLDFEGQTGSAWKAHGEMRLEDGVLEGLPILSQIKLNDTAPYRSIRFEKASCRISFPYTDEQHNIHDAWLWDHIDVRTKEGNFIVRGRVITGLDGTLSGTLQLAVPQQLVTQLGLQGNPAASQLFHTLPQYPGYVWVHVNLSGTLDDPHEDFSVRFATILPEFISSLSDSAIKSINSVIGDFLPHGIPSNKPQNREQEQQKDTPLQESEQKAKDIISSGLDILL